MRRKKSRTDAPEPPGASGWEACILLAAALLLWTGTATADPWTDRMHAGSAAFNQNKHADAVRHFEVALREAE